jgi:hypothetical protein
MMNESSRIRVLLPCRGAGSDLLRTLVSLSVQTIGPQRLNLVLASTAPDEHTSREARLLHSALEFGGVEVLDARDMPHARALNVAALPGDDAAAEPWLCLVPEGTRLSPHCLARCLESAGPGVQAVYPAHTAGSADGLPLLRMRPFRADQLTRANPVGPVALVRRNAWEELGGLRPKTRLHLWDLWLRMSFAGGRILRVPELLAHCRPLHRLSPQRDGQAKALLVVGAPGVFEPDVCRWALALLRGDAWAQPFEFGRIPGPREVRAMFAGMETAIAPRHGRWGQRRLCLA